MNAIRIKSSLDQFSRYFSFAHPAMSCRFSSVKPDNTVSPAPGAWTCMFGFLEQVAAGKRLCLSSENSGCSGAACYLGFREPGQRAGFFLAEKERFKKSVKLADAFYEEIRAVPAGEKYLVMECIDDSDDGSIPEVVVLWINSSALSGLVTLANYDRATNDNVIIPFASGCQSVWTIPCKERDRELPRCVVGMIDPAVRRYLSSHIISFSMPAKRFVEMAGNIPGSFLESKNFYDKGGKI